MNRTPPQRSVNRTLVITDLHLNSRVPGLLEAQCDCVIDIFRKENPTEVIIMGDVFMYRKPSPRELLGFKDILESIQPRLGITIIRGNHDSETKADDGVTALSLFESKNLGSNAPARISVVTQTYTDHVSKRVYIPHYENEKIIIEHLEMVPAGYTVFGHFGYDGCLNSVGDADFGISLSNFSTNTFLGHIHGFREEQGGLRGSHSRVVCLGTPYTTNFGEAFKENFYAILDDGGARTTKDTAGSDSQGTPYITEYKQSTCGPRHLVYSAKEIENNLEIINDPNYFTLLRIKVDSDHYPIPYDKIKVAHVGVVYEPIFDEQEISSYDPEGDLFSINEMIISDYVDSANSTIPREILMDGYRLLKDED
mgnify:CR=1 FL=1